MIKKTWFNKIAGLFLVLCLCVQLSMQAQSQEFRHISIRDGLPSGYIHTIPRITRGLSGLVQMQELGSMTVTP